MRPAGSTVVNRSGSLGNFAEEHLDRMPPDEVGCATSAQLAAAMIEFRTSGLPAADDGLTGGETAPFTTTCRPPMNAVRKAKDRDVGEDRHMRRRVGCVHQFKGRSNFMRLSAVRPDMIVNQRSSSAYAQHTVNRS